MSIEVKNLVKRFGPFRAVDNVSFRLDTGDLVALLGPSGSGKSTLLRVIAGLELPDEGEIILTGEEATFLEARHRNVGFVFQHYALFKHMTLRENIAFGLSIRKVPRNKINERVDELLDLVQLKGLGDRYPSQISGGQRQRVALARAMAPRPQVLLLDEPFGALDAKVREDLRRWIRRLHQEYNMTTLFVTHDQHEALEVANRVLVIHKGRVEQEGTPLEIFDHPGSQFVAEFVGESNYIETEISAPELAVWGPFRFTVNGPVGQKIRIYFRPNDVYVSSRPETLQVRAVISETRFRGATIELALDIGEDKHILAQVPKGVSLASGFEKGVRVYVGITAFQFFPLRQ